MPGKYYISVARLESENNISMIIDGHRDAATDLPLVIVGDIKRGYGRKIHAEYSLENNIRFTGGIFDSSTLNNLRHFSLGLFHGHSVGGTNPSLLEAMASGANIIAHENTYNRHILGVNARYFYSRKDIINILMQTHGSDDLIEARTRNVEKIRADYQWKTVTECYEKLFFELTENTKLSSGI